MRNRDLKDFAKKAVDKAEVNEPFITGDNVFKFGPQWLTNNPKSLDKPGITHAKWVANWWSRSLTQIVSQGHAQVSTIAFQDLLNEFLNINQIAVEKSEALAWAYDQHVWNNIQQKAERKDESLDLQEALSTVVQNDVDIVRQKIPSKDAGTKGLKQLGKGGKYKTTWNFDKGGGKGNQWSSDNWSPTITAENSETTKGSKEGKGKSKKDKGRGKK